MPGRSDGALVFDSNRNVAVLFGGNSGSGLLGDVWEYNGTWAERTFTTLPTARTGAQITFDSTRNVVVLFGGNDGIAVNDTWEYDGTTWTKKTPVDVPPARSSGALAYDPVRNVSVLFGGVNAAVERLDDTWEWNGTNWTQRSTLTESPVIDMNDKADGVWNYTTVHIGEGVTLSFDRNTNNTAVTWLTTGDVVIDGIVNISGQDGAAVTNAATRASGGPGGFDGGLGAQHPVEVAVGTELRLQSQSCSSLKSCSSRGLGPRCLRWSGI